MRFNRRRGGFHRVKGRVTSVAVAAGVLACAGNSALAQIKAFPQAEGFGAGAAGGRGGDVYHVTKLNDDGSAGTLRHALTTVPSSGRTVVFDVGGWITLGSKLGLTSSKVTIAGHTAPGGVGIKGAQFSVGGDDILVRHMRFRPGKATGSDHDSVNTNENAQRVIYDHISAEFSTDGGFDLQGGDVTLQYSSVSFGLYSHSTGGLIQNPDGGAAGKLSFHHNMFAHNQTRNPKARSELIDWRDNVVYNYHNGFLAGESDTDVNPNWKANFDGNTYISNIGSQLGGSGGRPMMTGGRTQNYDLWYGVNTLDRDSDNVADPISYTRDQARTNGEVVVSAYNWYDNAFDVGANATVWQNGSPAAAYARVLQEFGATPWARDAVNQLIHDQVISRTGKRIERESDLGLPNNGYPTLGGVAKPTDTDNDGIPDAWETKHGLPTNAASNNGDFDADGFTNLEEYLNDLGAFKAIGPLVFDGTGRYADWANWTNRWEPSRLDEVHVNTGTATVDAIGQRAGTLRVGTTAGSNGTLRIQSGWLEVTNDLQVGPAGPGTVTHTGGNVIAGTGVAIGASGVYQLSGGTLKTPVLSKSPTGTFTFTGGTLAADLVTFDLVNTGGTISPGASPGTMLIDGNLTLNAGTTLIELASGSIDQILIDGPATLGGVLDLRQISGFIAADGQAFTILQADELLGTFASITYPDGRNWGIHYDYTNDVVRVGVGVPEPTGLALILGGVLLTTRRVRGSDRVLSK